MADPAPRPAYIRWLQPVLSFAGALVAVVCVIAFFSLFDWWLNGASATFWTKQNLQTISVQNAFVAIAAIGMLLVIISGGIDLSAGVAMALCATLLAWGLREDLGFMLAHGENLPNAARSLKVADDALRDATRQADANQIQQAEAERNTRRQRLANYLEIKLTQLQAELPPETSNAAEASREQKTVAEVQAALAALKTPNSSIEADPAWLRVLPNAASSTWLALALALGCGVLCGILNGILVVFLRIVPFIATLGTMTIFLGLAKIIANETAIRPTSAQVPNWLAELSAVRPDPAWLIFSKSVWLALLLAAVMACVLRYTVFGRHVFALGSSEATARLCGINVPLTKIAVYALSGLLVGVAAVCFFSRLNTGNPTAGTGWELKFIAAVVIGGGSLSGGRGTVLGTIAGTAIMGVIASGCTLLGVRNPTQDIILGALIISAVTFDQLRRRRE